jgi:GAF domain
MAKQATSKAKQKDAGKTVGSTQANDRFDARLEAAQKRIRESVGQADTLEAIREIVTNLLGCEEIGLFTVKDGSSGLLWSFGIDTQQHGTLDSFDKSAMQRVLRGELHVAQMACEKGSDHPPLRVFVPICRNGRTVAVLVMLKLLPQKVSFDEADINLVKLLSHETGRVLFDGSANA